MSATLTERFWTKVTQHKGGCWLWSGAVGNTGYGQWAVRGTAKSVHRLAWMEFRGEIPEGLTVDHLCQRKLCVNPWHMELVPASVNRNRCYLYRNSCLLPVGTTAPWNRQRPVADRLGGRMYIGASYPRGRAA